MTKELIANILQDFKEMCDESKDGNAIAEVELSNGRVIMYKRSYNDKVEFFKDSLVVYGEDMMKRYIHIPSIIMISF